MQILAAVNDINLDIVVIPFPMFPAVGGYCLGIVCQGDWSVPIQYSLVSLSLLKKYSYFSTYHQATSIFILCQIGGSVVICFLYRHQALARGLLKLQEVSPNKFIRHEENKTVVAIRQCTAADHNPRSKCSRDIYSLYRV